MTKAAKSSPRADVERRCLVTGKAQPKADMIRFVAAPSGLVTPDLAQKLPGRGMWVSADQAALKKAAAKNLFSRAAKTQLSVPENFVELITDLILRRLQEMLALARKSGQAVCGYEKVRGWLASESIGALLQASDGSARGKGKLMTPQGARYINILSATELGHAFGRIHVIHAAVMAGPLAQRSVEEATRLAGLRKTTEKQITPQGTKDV